MTGRQSISGVLYARFDPKAGPYCASWAPRDLDPKLHALASQEAMKLSMGKRDQPKGLAIIPVGGTGQKALVKRFAFADDAGRGGIIEAALVLLFPEGEDIFFYTFIADFEAQFDEARTRIEAIEMQGGDGTAIAGAVDTFIARSSEIVGTLHHAEQRGTTKEAFPDVEEDPEQFKFKIIVVGDPAVGKTSLVLKFTDKAFKRTYLPTLGTNVCEKTVHVDGKRADLLLFDIAGHSKFTNVRKHFYHGASAILLTCDLTSKATFDALRDWHADIESTIGPKPGILVGNKTDLDGKVVSPNDLAALAGEWSGTLHIVTSALTGENVEQAFVALVRHLLDGAR